MNHIRSRNKGRNDFEIDLSENLNINNELESSSKELHFFVTNHLNTDLYKTTDNINTNKAKKFNIFSSQKTLTKFELKKTISDLFKTQKRPSIKSFNQNFRSTLINKKSLMHCFSTRNSHLEKNKIIKKNSVETKQNFIDDEDDMLLPKSSSFSNEYGEFLLKLEFIEDNDYDIDDSIRFNSVSYKKYNEDAINMRFFNKKTETTKNARKIDNLFFDEKEIINKNIIYPDKYKNLSNSKKMPQKSISSKTLKELKDWIQPSDNEETKNKELNDEPNISSISINLLIKKIALEDFRSKNYKIYKCIIQQFKSFITIINFIDKITSAFFFYSKSLGKYPYELVKLINKIILKNNIAIKEDKIALEHIQEFYSKIKIIKFESVEVNQEIIKACNLLFKKNNIDKEKNNKINDKTKNILIEQKDNLNMRKSNKKKEEKEKKNKYNYFYIFDYKNEEIASYLTNDCFNLMKNISEDELFNKNFYRKDKAKLAPNVTKLIDRYDKLILFIIEDICSYDHKSERVEVIEKWIKIAYVLKDLKNYNDLVMLSGLFFNYLLKKKLKDTWKKLSKKTLHSIDQLKSFCSPNQRYINIRKDIYKCKGPYIPYLGITLKEIMSAEEIEYIINDNINIYKLFTMDKIIERFFEFRKNRVGYSFDDLKAIDILSNINPKGENEIESMIKKIEPKLIIHANKGDKKRITNTDLLFYK